MAHDRRILIADDDSEIRQGMADLLSSLSLDILQAGTGDEALRILRRESLSLALLDNQMPGCTGLEILQTINSETIHVPCIFCSGDSGDGLAILARAHGALAVLRKPVQPVLLRQEVLRALELPPT